MRYIVRPYETTETTAPAGEPVTLAQAKAHLRIDHSDDETLITSLIKAARQYIERITGYAMVDRTVTAKIPTFADEIDLYWKPVTSITSFQYYTATSPQVLTAVDAGDYNLDSGKGVIYRAWGETFESHYERHDSIQIVYQAGHVATSSPLDYTENVPEPLRSAVLLTMSDLYENREGGIIGQGYVHVKNPTVERLIAPYIFRR